jgi:hypothetical protein
MHVAKVQFYDAFTESPAAGGRPSAGPGGFGYRRLAAGPDRGGCLEDAEQDVHEVGGERLDPEHGPGERISVEQAGLVGAGRYGNSVYAGITARWQLSA